MQGVHLDWDRPLGRCGDVGDRDNLFEFLKLLHNAKLDIMLSIPGIPHLAPAYSLPEPPPQPVSPSPPGPLNPQPAPPPPAPIPMMSNFDFAKHIIINTHRLRGIKRVVACYGTSDTAIEVVNAVRNLYHKHSHKFAYTISVRKYLTASS